MTTLHIKAHISGGFCFELWFEGVKGQQDKHALAIACARVCMFSFYMPHIIYSWTNFIRNGVKSSRALRISFGMYGRVCKCACIMQVFFGSRNNKFAIVSMSKRRVPCCRRCCSQQQCCSLCAHVHACTAYNVQCVRGASILLLCPLIRGAAALQFFAKRLALDSYCFVSLVLLLMAIFVSRHIAGEFFDGCRESDVFVST